MALISLPEVSLSFGAGALLDGATLHIERGDRICLLGRNGAGKSSLLRLMTGELQPDEGVIQREQGVRVSWLPQQVPSDLDGTVADVVGAGADSNKAVEGAAHTVEAVLSRLSLDGDAAVATLSAGLKRRVLLAEALAAQPDVLLLDEPTNHLDIDAIDWLEQFLARFVQTLLFVTHDRSFVQKLATRIVELDRGVLYSFPGGYARFKARRLEQLEAEGEQNARLDKKLAKEEAWLRRGLKARRARNEGRVRALERLREQRNARRARMGRVRLAVQEAERSGKLVFEAKKLSVGYEPDQPMVSELSTIVLRGDRVGVIGPNNCGKTTLLRGLLGQLEPLSGNLRLGTRVELAYFDQLREQLDDEKTVAQNVAAGDTVQLYGKPRHVLTYLQSFLFPPERARGPVSALSGGERNRLLLARLFLVPSNLLVLDEPTNDLDVETLELLEQQLIDYPGTVLVVSHDRAFLDNVVTSTLVFEGQGRVVEYAGGYSDWQKQRGAVADLGGSEPAAAAASSGGRGRKPKTEKPRRLSFKEQRELEVLPATIEQLEAEQAALHDKMADPLFYQGAGAEIGAAKHRLEQIGEELEAVYARWQELEEIASATAS